MKEGEVGEEGKELREVVLSWRARRRRSRKSTALKHQAEVERGVVTTLEGKEGFANGTGRTLPRVNFLEDLVEQFGRKFRQVRRDLLLGVEQISAYPHTRGNGCAPPGSSQTAQSGGRPCCSSRSCSSKPVGELSAYARLRRGSQRTF